MFACRSLAQGRLVFFRNAFYKFGSPVQGEAIKIIAYAGKTLRNNALTSGGMLDIINETGSSENGIAAVFGENGALRYYT